MGKIFVFLPSSLFSKNNELVDGAYETLTFLKNEGCALFFLDDPYRNPKITENEKLKDFFVFKEKKDTPDNIVFTEKPEESLREIRLNHRGFGDEFFVVGKKFYRELLAPIRAGYTAIHIAGDSQFERDIANPAAIYRRLYRTISEIKENFRL